MNGNDILEIWESGAEKPDFVTQEEWDYLGETHEEKI